MFKRPHTPANPELLNPVLFAAVSLRPQLCETKRPSIASGTKGTTVDINPALP